MFSENNNRIRQRRKVGFTLMEVMVAVSISTLVMTAVMGAFMWVGKQVFIRQKIGWSYKESMLASTKIMGVIRSASSVVNSAGNGNWVDMGFPDGTVRRLVYVDNVNSPLNGSLLILDDGVTNPANADPEDIIGSGIMRIPFSDGFGNSDPIFFIPESRSTVRVRYRISATTSNGMRAKDDGSYAVVVEFSAHMRNL